MNVTERKLLDRLDNLVLNAPRDELQKIQEIDLETQLTEGSFYEAFLNSKTMMNQTIRKESKDFQK